MTRVRDLITLRQQQDEKTEAITVRIPISYVAHLDELSSSLDVTRQFLLTEMIKEGVDDALDVYDKSRNNPEAMANDEEPVSGPVLHPQHKQAPRYGLHIAIW